MPKPGKYPQIVSVDGVPMAPASPLALKLAREANALHKVHPQEKRIKDKERVRSKAVKVADLGFEELSLRLGLRKKCPTCGCLPMSVSEVVAATTAGAKYGVGEQIEVTIENAQIVERMWIMFGKYIPPEQFPAAELEMEELFINMLPPSAEAVEEEDPEMEA